MLELQFREPDRWWGMWRDKRIRLVVAGTEHAPDAALEATLRGIIAGWQQVEQSIAAHLTSLAPSHHVPLEPASRGGFAARSCGFDQELAFESISVVDPKAPARVELTFYTGFPDGYATFRIVLVDGQPDCLTAFAS